MAEVCYGRVMINKLAIYFLAPPLMLLTVATASVAVDLSDYDSTTPMAQVYVKGVYEGFLWANGYNAAQGQPSMFCVPGKLALTGEQAVSIIDKHLEENSYGPDDQIEWIALRAMREVFPC